MLKHMAIFLEMSIAVHLQSEQIQIQIHKILIFLMFSRPLVSCPTKFLVNLMLYFMYQLA